jgi:hypothetical protein
MKTILTQETADIIKSKSNKEQAEFLFDIINEGNETLNANKEIIKANFAEMFHLMTMEIISSITGTALDALSNPAIESFTEDEGKAYIKNRIITNVVSQLETID